MQLKKELKDMNLIDRFLFAEAIENPDILEPILEIILGNDIVLEHKPQAEKEIRKHTWSKIVRLDVLSIDMDGTVYNAEVQQTDTGALPKRSRYYQSMVDTKLLPPGEINYNKLNDTYIIMICSFDLFGLGLYKYDFTQMCRNVPGLELGDGASRIFLNTKGTVMTDDTSQELVDLLHYIEESTDIVAEQTDSERIKRIHRGVTAIKNDEEVGIKLMNRWEEMIEDRKLARAEGLAEGRTEGLAEGRAKGHAEGLAEGRAEGRSEGRADAKKETAVNMLKEGLSIDMIARITGLSEEVISELKE